MKRLLILLAIGLMSISCKSVEDKALDFCQDLYEEAMDEDLDDFRECATNFCLWFKDLSHMEQKEVEWILHRWMEDSLEYSMIVEFATVPVPCLCELDFIMDVVYNDHIHYIYDPKGYLIMQWDMARKAINGFASEEELGEKAKEYEDNLRKEFYEKLDKLYD